MKFYNKVLAVFLLAAISLFVLVVREAFRPQTGPAIWNMPVAYSETNFHTVKIKEFAAKINQCTDNRIQINVHSSGSLFKGHEIKRAVQTGVVPIGERLLSSHVNENPLFAVDSIPFLASSFEDSELLWQASKGVLEEVLNEEGLVLLYSAPWPPQGMYFQEEITTPEALKGLKLRTYNESTARMAERAGMISILIEESEVTQALAVGLVNAVMASGSTGYDKKLWEQVKYFYDLQAWLPRNYVFVNEKAFQQLSAHDQGCFINEAVHTEAAITTRSRELTNWYLSQLAENGMEVAALNPSLRAFFDTIGKAELVAWLELTGPEGEVILQRYRAAKQN